MIIDMKEKMQKAGAAVEKAGSAAGKAAGKSASAIKTTAAGIAVKIKENSVKEKLKKLNPLFPDEYASEAFHLPNLIVIVDDAVRRNEALCEGAIGWRSTVKEVEVLYLYDEFVKESGLRFVPAATCDTAYFVDPHDRSQFIRVDGLFERTQQEKLAELAHVAYCLGAKRYSVEMQEETAQKSSAHTSVKAKLKGVPQASLDSSEEHSLKTASGSVSKSLANVEFTEARAPVEPTLKWFVHDNYICELIRQRCSGNGGMRSVDIVLSGSDYSTMSASTSVKVDAAVCKIGLNTNAHIEASSAEERSHKLLFHLEF